MNEMIGTTIQTPIENALGVDENGMTTARNLYDFLELGKGQFSRWAKANIENNEFYQEGHDWWGFDIVSNGNKCRDYRLTTDFAKHLSMESHSEKGKIARQYFVNIEDKAKQHLIDRTRLSPQTQLILAMSESIARTELEQKRQAEQLNRLEDNQRTLIDTFQVAPANENFQLWVNHYLSKVAESPNFHSECSRQSRYALSRNESYDRLKKKWNCNLNDRVTRAKGRAMEHNPGITKTELNSINKLTVIVNDKSLRPVYETVIKEMMMQYCTEIPK